MSLIVKNPSKIDLSIPCLTKSVNSRGHQLSTTNDTVFLRVPLRISVFSALKIDFNAENAEVRRGPQRRILLPLNGPIDDPEQGSDGNPRRTF